MNIRIDHYHHMDSDGLILKAITALEKRIMATLDDIAADMASETTAIDSLATLISGLRQQIADALSGVTLPPAVQDKIDAIFVTAETNKQKLSDALAANVEPPA